MYAWRLNRLVWLAVSLAAGGLALLSVTTMTWGDKIVIGAVENVILLPWGVAVPARIDTGAASSALDVQDVKLLPGGRIEFRLSPRAGGYAVQTRLAGWRSVKSSSGVAERRPVVIVEMVLGPKRLKTPVTLADRSQMEFPLLIGRRTLGRGFIVDVTREHLLPPGLAGEPTR